MTKEQAIKLHESEFWKTMTDKEIATFQLFEERLCMPFSVFHGAMEATLGRPIFTHEFAYEDLKKEFLGEKKAPTFKEIINLIPKEKRIILTK